MKPVLRVLPNLEVAAVGAELDGGDRLALDCYAERASERVWRLEARKLLGATEEGRAVAEIREFLSARSGAPLPDTVVRLLEDVEERSTRIQDRGLARLVECDEPALAALIANDTRTRRHCMRAGERHLAVPAASEAAFRRGLREVGYLVARGKSPEHVHTYRLTPLSIWNARSAGLSGAAMIAALREHGLDTSPTLGAMLVKATAALHIRVAVKEVVALNPAPSRSLSNGPLRCTSRNCCRFWYRQKASCSLRASRSWRRCRSCGSCLRCRSCCNCPRSHR